MPRTGGQGLAWSNERWIVRPDLWFPAPVPDPYPSSDFTANCASSNFSCSSARERSFSASFFLASATSFRRWMAVRVALATSPLIRVRGARESASDSAARRATRSRSAATSLSSARATSRRASSTPISSLRTARERSSSLMRTSCAPFCRSSSSRSPSRFSFLARSRLFLMVSSWDLAMSSRASDWLLLARASSTARAASASASRAASSFWRSSSDEPTVMTGSSALLVGGAWAVSGAEAHASARMSAGSAYLGGRGCIWCASWRHRPDAHAPISRLLATKLTCIGRLRNMLSPLRSSTPVPTALGLVLLAPAATTLQAQQADGSIHVVGNLNFVNTARNSQLTTLSGDETLQEMTADSLCRLQQTAAAVYGRSVDSTTASAFTAGARVDRILSSRLSAFVGGNWQRNRYAGITRRFEELVGLGYQLLALERDQLSLEAGTA